MSGKWKKRLSLVMAIALMSLCALGEELVPAQLTAEVEGEYGDIIIIEDTAVDDTGEFLLFPEDAPEDESGGLIPEDAPKDELGGLIPEENPDIAGDEAGEAPDANPESDEAVDAGDEGMEVIETGSLRIALKVMVFATPSAAEAEEGGEAPEGEAQPAVNPAEGRYLFDVTGPNDYAICLEIDYAGEDEQYVQLDGLMPGTYTVALRQDTLPEGVYCLSGDGMAEIGGEHTMESPLQLQYMCAWGEPSADAYASGQSAVANQCTIGVGELYQIPVYGLYGVSASAVKYHSSNTKVVKVNDSGVIKGIKAGKATITILAPNGNKASFGVTVKKAPTKVKLNATKGKLAVGQQYKLVAKLSPSGCAPGVNFKSSDSRVVSVSPDGTLTGMSVGTATVSASTYNGKKATCKVTVLCAPQSVALNHTSASMVPKGTLTLKAVCSPSGCVNSVTYTTSNASVAKVSTSGKVTAVGKGTATISATTCNGLTATCVVTVRSAPTKVALNQKTAKLCVGQSIQLVAAVSPGDANATVAWGSSNSKIASVKDGVVTAKKAGTVTITAKTINGKKATCKVSVLAAPKSVSVSAAKTTLVVGESTQVKATLTKNTYTELKWSVEGDAVVYVDGGYISAVAGGTAVVRATASNGISGSVTIKVNAATQTDSPKPSTKQIIDISKWQGSIDFDALKPYVSLVFVRATCGTDVDSRFNTNASAMKARGIPFGVYCYSHAATAAEARKEAQMLYSVSSKYGPRFYVIDAEEAAITQEALVAYVAELRRLGAKRVGAYVGHHRYTQYGFSAIKGKFDFVWIPRYGKNDGTVANSVKPSYPCDLWQYSSFGKVPGISGRVDVNIVTGQGKSLSWFTG